jgi:hypothetical protein
VDPGKHGAIATIASVEEGVEVRVEPIPVFHASKGKGRDEYDLIGIRELLADIARRDHAFVTLERSQPLPKEMGGGIANYHRGFARGFEWMLVAFHMPYQLVAPPVWMRVMHAGTPGRDTKQRSKLAAQRFFPDVDLKRTERNRVIDHNYAEALLLAEFGRRTQVGGEP